MKKIIKLTCAILIANATMSMAQDITKINGSLEVFPKDGGWRSSINLFDPAKVNLFHITQDVTGRLVFGYNDAGKHLTILSNGNVGIGTYTPQTKLQVAGIISIAPNAISESRALNFMAAEGTNAKYASIETNSTSGNLQIKSGGNNSGLGFSTSFFTDDVERMKIMSNGNIGIGTTTPTYKLQVTGTIYGASGLFDTEFTPYGYGTRIAAYGQNGDVSIAIKREINTPSSWWIRTPSGSTDLDFFNGGTAMKISGNGLVSIGTNIPVATNYKLAVGGDIIAERVVVKLQASWPDYVFSPNYQRASLPEVEKYILQNNHLPNVPSAAEVADKGIDVGAMNTKLMEKVEELTLYLIEQNKRMEALEKKNDSLEKAIQQLKK